MDIIYACFLLCSFIGTLNAIVLDSPTIGGERINGFQGDKEIARYMASLQISGWDGPNSTESYWVHICGSGVITLKFLLTAGFCVVYMLDRIGDNYNHASAVIGTNDLFYPAIVRHSILLAKAHPLYCSTSRAEARTNYDVGVIMLERDIDTLYGAPLSMDKMFLLRKRHPLFAGWGCDHLEDEEVSFENSCVSRFLMAIVLNIREKTECLETYPFLTLTSPQLCASGGGNIKTSWRDIGGPLILMKKIGKKSAYYVAGVASGVVGKSNPFLIRFIRFSYLRPTVLKMMQDLEKENQMV